MIKGRMRYDMIFNEKMQISSVVQAMIRRVIATMYDSLTEWLVRFGRGSIIGGNEILNEGM